MTRPKVLGSIRDTLDPELQEALDPLSWEEDYRASVHPVTHPDADRVTGRLPGDDIGSHPLFSEPNHYFSRPYSTLAALVRSGGLSREEEKKVRAAMRMQELSR